MAETKPSVFTSLRDLFAACREFAIVALIVLFVARPTLVRQMLQNAGIKTFGGIEFWDQASKDADAAVAADATIAHLEQEIVRIAEKLKATNGDEAQNVLESVTKLKAESSQTREQLMSRIQEQATILKSAPARYRTKGEQLQRYSQDGVVPVEP